ncbi:hypothetical protein C7M84_025367 [Penaeus vannamei]|uniref:Uncharacterized protein n=1 Tax=Penaeus vannamei TaxID=6689 RepID=A0A3R7MFU2_PENVA|nr:hypothetical protein C7M84_025367 [Penaeus vannamei]
MYVHRRLFVHFSACFLPSLFLPSSPSFFPRTSYLFSPSIFYSSSNHIFVLFLFLPVLFFLFLLPASSPLSSSLLLILFLPSFSFLISLLSSLSSPPTSPLLLLLPFPSLLLPPTSCHFLPPRLPPAPLPSPASSFRPHRIPRAGCWLGDPLHKTPLRLDGINPEGRLLLFCWGSSFLLRSFSLALSSALSFALSPPSLFVVCRPVLLRLYSLSFALSPPSLFVVCRPVLLLLCSFSLALSSALSFAPSPPSLFVVCRPVLLLLSRSLIFSLSVFLRLLSSWYVVLSCSFSASSLSFSHLLSFGPSPPSLFVVCRPVLLLLPPSSLSFSHLLSLSLLLHLLSLFSPLLSLPYSSASLSLYLLFPLILVSFLSLSFHLLLSSLSFFLLSLFSLFTYPRPLPSPFPFLPSFLFSLTLSPSLPLLSSQSLHSLCLPCPSPSLPSTFLLSFIHFILFSAYGQPPTPLPNPSLIPLPTPPQPLPTLPQYLSPPLPNTSSHAPQPLPPLPRLPNPQYLSPPPPPQYLPPCFTNRKT